MIMVRIFQKNKNEFAIGISMSCGHFDEYYCILCLKIFPSYSSITIMKRDLKKYITSSQVCFQVICYLQKRKNQVKASNSRDV